MELGQQQLEAERLIEQWWEGPDQVFYLGGWAGTGKTTLAMPLASRLVGSNVAYAAFTGKAALRMREVGCINASTVHSWIYHSSSASAERLKELEEQLRDEKADLYAEGYQPNEVEDHPRVQHLNALIQAEEAAARRPMFRLNLMSDLKDCKLGVLDEVSMVTQQMKDDWCSFGVKTLVMGDPFQLPPVGGEGAFTNRKPDYMLTEIHRQAEGNPIIQLASAIRSMEYPRAKDWGNGTRVLRKEDLTPTQMRNIVINSDQVIVGRNATRHSYNNRMRVLLGYKGKWPNFGEKVVCLRNNHEKGLLNGAIYKVVNDPDVYEDIERIDMILEPIDGGQQIEVHAHTHHFVGKEEALKKRWFERSEAEEFDYGYALTCHKAQGSQYKNPVVFDESAVAREHRYRWLYTAVTRAQESLTLIL